MTGHRTHALVAALSFTAAATLSACGSSGEDKPTTQAVEKYAKTEAAKRKTTGASSPSTPGTPTDSEHSASTRQADGGAPATGSASTSSEPLPGEVTDTAKANAARKAVRNYIAALNKAGRQPSTRNTLDAFTTDTCKSCTALKETLGKLAKAKQKLGGDLVNFSPSDVRTGSDTKTVRVFGTLDQGRTPILDKDGKVTSHTKDSEPVERAFFVRTSTTGRTITEIKVAVG